MPARGQQLLSNPNREPTLDELVRDYLGTVPPAEAEARPEDAVIAPPDTVPAEAPPQPQP